MRPVLVCLGTSAAASAGPAFAAIAEGLRQRGLRSLLLVGNSTNLVYVRDVPGAFEFAPVTAVVDRCSAAVVSGALGTLAAALTAGVPVVVLPQLFDQVWHGRRVEELGVGIMVTRAHKVPAAVAELLHDHTYRDEPAPWLRGSPPRMMPPSWSTRSRRRSEGAACPATAGMMPDRPVLERRLATYPMGVGARDRDDVVVDVCAAYESFLRERHRPAHARRTVDSFASFFVRHVRSGHRLVDLGCGPGSVTVGFAAAVGPRGMVVGVDLDPGPAPVPLVRGDINGLPFPDGSFDAIFMCAVLQQVPDPLIPLVEARRIARSGAVIGVADADWGGFLLAPEDPWLARGQEIMTWLRAGTSPFVGRQLRGLLHAAGFVDVQVTARGTGGGGPGCVGEAEFQASFFDARPVIDLVTDRGLASPDEMAAIAAAWRRWGIHPAAIAARHWFEAVARADAD